MESFGARLRTAMDRYGPLCAGIDPHRELVESWGLTYDLDGLRTFTDRCVEAFAGQVGVVKPQSAFFEVFGSPGIQILEEATTALRARGTIVILDAKRGDIGATMAAYAEAFLGNGAVAPPDAVTVNPYLGYGSLRQAIAIAKQSGRGVFVLALTSNPEGASIQHAMRAGRSVAGTIVDGATADNATAYDAGELGHVGLVVGATVGSAVRELNLDLAAMGGPILAPGFGAQGGSSNGLHSVFGDVIGNVLVASSRDILSAGPDPMMIRAAAYRTIGDLAL